jgi:hypothetical protein
MNPRIEKQETYRERLTRLAQALALGHGAVVLDDLAAGSHAGLVKMFLDGNLDKRFEKLQRQVEFLEPAFVNLDELLASFIRHVPLQAYDTGASDGERFLQWLEQTERPLPEQRDYIACQRGRHAVEAAARVNRLGHVRFQDLLSMSPALAEELETNPRLKLCLNPIRVWSRFETTELLDEAAEAPAEVVFFPVGGDIHTAILEGDGLERVRELSSLGPATIEEWLRLLEPFSGLEDVSRSQLIAMARDLSDIGLIAFS